MRTYAQIQADLTETARKFDRLAEEALGAEGEALARLKVGMHRAEEDREHFTAELADFNRARIGDFVATGQQPTDSPWSYAAEGPFTPAERRPSPAATGPTGQLRSQASRTIDSLHRAGSLPDHGAERATGLLSTGTPYERDLAARWAIATGDPAYLTAFQKLIGDPQRGHLLFDKRELEAYRAVYDLRAAGLTIAGTGQYMIPLTLDPSVILTSAGADGNPMRRICRVVQTVTNTWQGVTSAGVTAEWVNTEATQVAEATPTLAPLSIPVVLGDAYLHASFQSVMDVVDFQGEMSRVLLDAADTLAATAYTVGAGTTEPTGLVTALVATHIDGKGSEALAGTDPFDLQAALVARFQPGAVFMAHQAIINGYSIMETTNGGRLFPEIGSGRLLNRDLIENSAMDGVIDPAATESNYVLAYFQPQQFIIADRIGSTLEVIQNVVGADHRPTAERGFLLWFRTGSNLSTAAAGQLLKIATTA